MSRARCTQCSSASVRITRRGGRTNYFAPSSCSSWRIFMLIAAWVRCTRSVSALEVRDCAMAFFFSSRRRHTRFDCDWRFRRVLFRSKSTLLNIVAGLTPATSGNVFVDNREVVEPGPDRAVVFQNHSLLPWLTVYQNVRLAVDKIFGRSEERRVGKECRARVAEQQ